MKTNQRFLTLFFMHVFLTVLVLNNRAEIGKGQPVPPFKLPTINGNENIKSQDLFRQNQLTVLVFWKSNCKECVRNLRACGHFFIRNRQKGIGIAAVHTDAYNFLRAKTILEENGIAFTNLWDPAGNIENQYGIRYDAFSVFLVDSDGILKASNTDVRNDLESVLDAMLQETIRPDAKTDTARTRNESSLAGASKPDGWNFRGEQRIRWLSIDSRGSDAVGLYGEPVTPGNRSLYRFDFEAARSIGPHVTAGGLLRIGNEGKKILRSGPDYFGSEWGSAFLEMNRNALNFRIGYYAASMTPLTLMRWDWDDNPRIGGDGGCGCAGSAGLLTLENLETLGPDLRIEGGTIGYKSSAIEAKLFYAMPKRPVQNTYKSLQIGDIEKAAYSLELSGFHFQWRRLHSGTGSFWKFGTHVLTTWEDRRSTDFSGLGYLRPDPWHESIILTLTGEVPLLRYVGLRGEWIAWNPMRQHNASSGPTQQEGHGGMAGLVFEKPPRLFLKVDYLRLSPDFYSPFAAVSYEKNREGLRISSRFFLPGMRLFSSVTIPTDAVELSFFSKNLREIEKPFPEVNFERITTYGASIGIRLGNGFGTSAGWLNKIEKREGEVLPFQKRRQALSLELYAGFGRSVQFHLQYQSVDFTHETWSRNLESMDNVFSFYVIAVF